MRSSGIAVIKEENKYYDNLQAAVDDAKAGDTVMLLENITESIKINKSITLDLGNNTITGSVGSVITAAEGDILIRNGIIKPQETVEALFNNYKGSGGTTGDEDRKSLEVQKIWDDDDDKYEKRPESILVQLYRNGEKYGAPVELTAENEWRHLWNGLDPNYKWSAAEVEVPDGYEMTQKTENNRIIITNSYENTEDWDDSNVPDDSDPPDETNDSATPDGSEHDKADSDSIPKTGDDMRVNLCLMLMLALTTGVLMIFLKLFAWKKD